MADSFTAPAGHNSWAAGVVTEIWWKEWGVRAERAVKLREVEDKSVGDYLTAKGPDGPLGDGELPHHVWVTPWTLTHNNKELNMLHKYII